MSLPISDAQRIAAQIRDEVAAHRRDPAYAGNSEALRRRLTGIANALDPAEANR